MISPETSYNEISDSLLLNEFNQPTLYKKMNLYALMARRANDNMEIKSKLINQLLDMDARQEVIAGNITHAWFPAIYILQEGKHHLIESLKEALRKWSEEERKLFIEYIRSEKKFYLILEDL